MGLCGVMCHVLFGRAPEEEWRHCTQLREAAGHPHPLPAHQHEVLPPRPVLGWEGGGVGKLTKKKFRNILLLGILGKIWQSISNTYRYIVVTHWVLEILLINLKQGKICILEDCIKILQQVRLKYIIIKCILLFTS